MNFYGKKIEISIAFGGIFFILVWVAALFHPRSITMAAIQHLLETLDKFPVSEFDSINISSSLFQTNELTQTTYLPVAFKENYVPISYRTGIDNIYSFLEKCPNNDPAYSKIRNDFKIRIDGHLVTDIPCTEPYPTIPISQLTQPLITVQALRVIYHMDPGISNLYPWTSVGLYDWMATNIGGFNLVTSPGKWYCCDIINGEKYVVESIQDETERERKRAWMDGIDNTIGFFAHEVRHADGGPKHVNGCEAFPNPTDPLGCDLNYDLNNLGSIGVRVWLQNSWYTGYLNVGISCNSEMAEKYIKYLNLSLNHVGSLFVSNPPPLVEMPDPPYGGPCFDN